MKTYFLEGQIQGLKVPAVEDLNEQIHTAEWKPSSSYTHKIFLIIFAVNRFFIVYYR